MTTEKKTKMTPTKGEPGKTYKVIKKEKKVKANVDPIPVKEEVKVVVEETKIEEVKEEVKKETKPVKAKVKKAELDLTDAECQLVLAHEYYFGSKADVTIDELFTNIKFIVDKFEITEFKFNTVEEFMLAAKAKYIMPIRVLKSRGKGILIEMAEEAFEKALGENYARVILETLKA